VSGLYILSLVLIGFGGGMLSLAVPDWPWQRRLLLSLGVLVTAVGTSLTGYGS
jgi:hypothetical protein